MSEKTLAYYDEIEKISRFLLSLKLCIFTNLAVALQSLENLLVSLVDQSLMEIDADIQAAHSHIASTGAEFQNEWMCRI